MVTLLFETLSVREKKSERELVAVCFSPFNTSESITSITFDISVLLIKKKVTVVNLTCFVPEAG